MFVFGKMDKASMGPDINELALGKHFPAINDKTGRIGIQLFLNKVPSRQYFLFFSADLSQHFD